MTSFISDPRLLRSPFARPSTVQMPMECVLLGDTPLLEMVGERRSTWSLGKYEMEDCRRGFGDLKLRALGGGVESPRDDTVRGDSTGDELPGERLLSSNCRDRGPIVGEETAGELGVADATALMVSSRLTDVMTG